MLGFVTKPVKKSASELIALAVKGFWTGFWTPLRAAALIARSPSLLLLIIVPLAVNIGLYLLFFHYGADYLGGLIAAALAKMSQALPGWLVSISGWILKVLAWLTLGLIAALTFTIVGGIISAPFNDRLSKAVLKRHFEAQGGPPPHLARHSLAITLWLEIKRMGVLIVGALIALVIGLIPLLQPVALVIGALLVSFEYFGYPISQHSSHLRPVALFTLRHPALSLGFGAFLLLLMSLPLASLVYIPMAVAGGTLLYVEHHRYGASTPHDTSRK